jgi:hypothetical protein
VTAGGQEGEALRDLAFDLFACPSEECAEAPVKSEFAVMKTNKIDDGAGVFAMIAAQTTPELLKE